MLPGRPPRPRPPAGAAAGTWPLPLLLLLYCGAAAAVYHLGGPLPGGWQGAAQRRLGDGGATRPAGGATAAGGSPGEPAEASAAPHSQQPQHKFLIFFSGHQGSSALADMLAALPPVFVPVGCQPLPAAAATGACPAAHALMPLGCESRRRARRRKAAWGGPYCSIRFQATFPLLLLPPSSSAGLRAAGFARPVSQPKAGLL